MNTGLKDNDCQKTMTADIADPEQVVRAARECLACGHKYFQLGPPSEGNLMCG